jgi:hypothetical protein
MTALLLGPRTAICPAPNLVRAKAWYAQVLRQAPYFDEPFYVGFEVGGFKLGLLTSPSCSATTATPSSTPAPRPPAHAVCSRAV